ncbi:hypothetical protein M422DRAFT_76544 [Sphaerobolus stellatus SS14]|uniref:J domain-containing protein n=1 Tax=Sphaerobolus stellatus (strain SS14) TaxID=990650 RepID=A0A0C9V4G8_SPHS4|nr:hypothetical protein M422DRAFT_76544 [Sphaerobolus stellatus SS14]
MAQYQYDGSMAAYFLLTFLSLILVPLTYSFIPSVTSNKPQGDGCRCEQCVRHKNEVRNMEKQSGLASKINKKAILTLVGWAVFAATAYKVAITPVENTIYDPFAILGLKRSATEKEIKKHYKKLSVKFHPDKVKLGPNETLEGIQDYFVNLTKAYKSLTDETIRQNVINFNDPDGRQQFSTGIAIPQWIVEGKNSIWVLAFYGLLFGVGLPILVGRWWFGSRKFTKDGVQTRTAELFFKEINEDALDEDIMQSVGKALTLEKPLGGGKTTEAALAELSKQVESRLGGSDWGKNGLPKALVLVYAHLLRLPIQDKKLLKNQRDILLHTPSLLNSLLNIAVAYTWLLPAIRIMHLHANLAQAVLPGTDSIIQFPGMDEKAQDLPDTLERLIERLEEKEDPRIDIIRKVGEKWGRLDVVDVTYKVIGERFVTPGAIVQLVIKLRIKPPVSDGPKKVESDVEQERRIAKLNDEKDQAFLLSKKDFEDIVPGDASLGWAHAPRWPADRRPRWWVVLGDDKTNRIVVPPTQVSDLPFADPTKPRDYRSFKLQFQAPQNVGLYTWRIRFISDTYIGEDVARDLPLKVEDLSELTADEQHKDDDISDPEEDTIAGQMAAMRGGGVKRIPGDSEESSTDGEEDEDSDDSSDSD